MSSLDDLRPDESELVGSWTEHRGATSHDSVDERIFWLVSRRLIARGSANGGWDQLYLDPRDGRLWELTFPHGSLHGGGPRRLAVIGEAEARAKYGL